MKYKGVFERSWSKTLRRRLSEPPTTWFWEGWWSAKETWPGSCLAIFWLRDSSQNTASDHPFLNFPILPITAPSENPWEQFQCPYNFFLNKAGGNLWESSIYLSLGEAVLVEDVARQCCQIAWCCMTFQSPRSSSLWVHVGKLFFTHYQWDVWLVLNCGWLPWLPPAWISTWLNLQRT